MDSILNEYYLESKNIIDNIKIPFNGKRKCAIFVMVQNEKIFLPIWLKYYSQFFDGEDIFVFDHKSSDGSVEECSRRFKFKAIRLDYPYSFDHKWFKFVAETMQTKLLEFYEYVIFTDVDEILLANTKRYKGLNDYVNKLRKKYVKCKGYEIIHLKEKEKRFDPEKPVLRQRKFWYRNLWWDKTLLTSKPLNWKIGFHQVSRSVFLKFLFRFMLELDQDSNLLLVHLHKLDFDMCWNKTLQRAKLPWPEEELKSDGGWQNRITDFEKFKDYYYVWPPERKKTTEIPQFIIDTELF